MILKVPRNTPVIHEIADMVGRIHRFLPLSTAVNFIPKHSHHFSNLSWGVLILPLSHIEKAACETPRRSATAP